MVRPRRVLGCLVIAALIMMLCGIAAAADKKITVGYQLVYNPWKVAIAAGAFEKATGYEIDWRKFEHRRTPSP